MRFHRSRKARFICLVVSGVILGIVGYRLPFLNWRRTVSPLEADLLVVRFDGKGDGRFLAPRNGGRRHRGIDLAAAVGGPVYAIRSGRVREVGTDLGLGKFVSLKHDGTLSSLYAHLDTLLVTDGQRVRQGQKIGTVGKTGNARHPVIQPHLHLEVMQRDQRINPAQLGLEIVDASSSKTQTSAPSTSN